jgi:carbamoyl-phosphate synthase small subunit
MTAQPAILVLADGNVFHGQAFGKIGTTTGEICFNTGMTGYQEVFTLYGRLLPQYICTYAKP